MTEAVEELIVGPSTSHAEVVESVGLSQENAAQGRLLEREAGER
jgi:hypothetical protein